MPAPDDPSSAFNAVGKPKIRAKAHVIPIQPAEDDGLYEVRKKVYPRAVTGRFATWRWIMVWLTQLLFYGLCWVPWNGRQSVLFDLVERKFYIFGWVFWPQDVFYLAVLLIISALSLFLFTAVAGRLWCGFTCPQTVYTEIFMWIEQKIEGNRQRQMKLDQMPWGGQKILIKGAKYLVWAAVALWTGITFVGYFTPIKPLVLDIAGLGVSGWSAFWILFYGGFTYLMAGVMREQVCKYMCPYARFQSVMFDPDTLVITYDTSRGEPRGSRKRGVEPRSIGKGDCVNCGICVQVCPTGIDIRQGLQYECIGCAACIDACDQVMDKMGYPPGLIRYSTENAIEKRWGRKEIVGHVLRPRVLIYAGVLAAIVLAFAYALVSREDIRVDVIKDRTTLTREVEDGLIENVYILHLMNMAEAPRTLSVTATGMEGIRIDGRTRFDINPAENSTATLRVRVPVDSAGKGSHPIYFEVRAEGHADEFVREKAVFIMP
ncbi:MAG: cytochrome c oxidase accessory protein CcoG [Rhodocyclaceae bacterium]